MKYNKEIMEPTNEALETLEAELNEDYSCEVLQEEENLNLEDSFTNFLRDIEQYSLLTPAEELELGAKVQAGGVDAQAARKELTNANYRLVISIAKKYAKAVQMDIMDVIMMGVEGLMTAVDHFDPSKGFRFSTYAQWWIRQAITRGIENEGYAIRMPASSKSERIKVVSLDAPNMKDSDANLADILPDENCADPYECAEQGNLRESLKEALNTLNEKEALLLELHTGLADGRQYSLKEIGKRDEFQVSRERARQIKRNAIEKLNRNSRIRESLLDFVL